MAVSSVRILHYAAAVALILLAAQPLQSEASPIADSDYEIQDAMERRAVYWPGMWDFDGSSDVEEAGGVGKRGYYWPGMWNFDRSRKMFDKRGYYWPGMWNFDRRRKLYNKKRGYFWPGMWRHQQQLEQRAPVMKRSYGGYGGYGGYGYGNDFYWLGKACGETGDMDACSILNGMYYY